MSKIKIAGAGLAGCEATLQLAKFGFSVELYEMRPQKMTEAHRTGLFAELICSNSLKSSLVTTSSGLLKAELKLLDCELLKIANECAVPAGNALAVDRIKFADAVTQKVESNPNITIIHKEVTELDNSDWILASGPLTSSALSESLQTMVGDEHLYFYDAIAPIVCADSIDMDIVYRMTRYEKGDADYVNCPFSREEYYHFVEALVAAEKHEAREFEKPEYTNTSEEPFKFYENCTPIEELARRGKDTLRFGVLKPVGLVNPKTNSRPFAVLQLRTEDAMMSAYNLVGCQTMMKYGEQKNVFRLIPGLKNVEFIRYGSIHRNTYLNTPQICNQDFSLKNAQNIRLAGQITGVEGYVESIFSGLLTAQIMAGKINTLPPETIAGQLQRYLTTPKDNFVPMNANFGLLPEISMNQKNKKLKKEKLSQRSIEAMETIKT